MKRQISILLTAMMVMGSTIGVYGANFSDINNVPWAGAVTYINEVADAGIMVGSNVDGKMVFRAKDAVTLCETTQLVYSLIEKTGSLKSTDGLEAKWTDVMKGYNIPAWAYKGVSYCLENNIIAAGDLKAFMSGTTSQGAKREQVAYMIGRALQTIDGDLTGGGAVTFKDATKISAVAIPYVEMLNKQGIMTGDSDGNFNPSVTINRAEMAVVISKSLSKIKELKASEAPTDTTTDTTTDTMPKIDGGTTTTPGTTTSGTTTDMPSISGLGNAAGVVYEVQVNGENRLVVLNTASGHVGYMGSGGMAISYADGSTGILSDVQAGDSVSITYENSKIVTLTNNSAKKTPTVDTNIKTKGSLQTLSSRVIRISGGDELYITRDVGVKIDGDKEDLDELLDLYDSDEDIEVELELDSNNDVTYITATIKESSSDDGEISSISESRIKVDGSSYDLADEDDLDIDITDGNSSITDLDDLIEAVEDDDKEISVTLTEKSDEVTKIKGEVIKVEGTLTKVTTSSDKIEIETSGGNKYVYTCASNVEIDVDGEDMDIDDLYDYLDEEDEFEITIKLKSGKVSELSD